MESQEDIDTPRGLPQGVSTTDAASNPERGGKGYGGSIMTSQPDKRRKRSAHLLIGDRQRRGRCLFAQRSGAGVWSPDRLHQGIGVSSHYLRRMEISAVLKGHNGCVNTVTATPDGQYWITGSDDTRLMVRSRCPVLVPSGIVLQCGETKRC